MIFPEIASFYSSFFFFFQLVEIQAKIDPTMDLPSNFSQFFPQKIRLMGMVTFEKKKEFTDIFSQSITTFSSVCRTTLIGLECYWVASRGLVNFYIYFEKKLTNGVVLLSYGDVTSPRHRGNSFAPRNELGNASLRSAGFSQLRLLSRGHIYIYLLLSIVADNESA